MESPANTAFPRLCWLDASWVLVYLPAYTLAYGAANFLFLCNIGVIVTAVGLIVRNRLLVSSQAVAVPVTHWSGWMQAGGWSPAIPLRWHPLSVGPAAYPLFTRLLSLYHVAWPLLLVWILRRTGYDRRGWALQAGIAALAMGAGRWRGPRAENINFAWQNPFFGPRFGPAPVHLLVSWAALTGIAYWLLKRWFRP